MPVKDNIQPEKQIENEEEKRRKAVENMQESSNIKSQKLLPFLNMKAEFHQSRIDTTARREFLLAVVMLYS